MKLGGFGLRIAFFLAGTRIIKSYISAILQGFFLAPYLGVSGGRVRSW